MDPYKFKDLSPKEINSTVKKRAVQSPLTSYSGALCLLGLFYIGLFGLSHSILILSVIIGCIALANWVFKAVIKGDQAANALVIEHRTQLKKKRQASVTQLQHDLKKLKNTDAVKQLSLFEKKYAAFFDILNKKLNPNELAYNRYLGIAEHVYLGGLDNLSDAAVLLQSTSAIDIEHINNTLKKLDNSPESQTNREALEERLALANQAQVSARNLQLQNELALTQLDKVTSKMATIQTHTGNTSVALEDSMEELKQLINRADQLSN